MGGVRCPKIEGPDGHVFISNINIERGTVSRPEGRLHHNVLQHDPYHTIMSRHKNLPAPHLLESKE